MVRKPYERKIDKLSEEDARRTLNRSDMIKRAERQQINVERFLNSKGFKPFTGREFSPSDAPLRKRANRRKPLKNTIQQRDVRNRGRYDTGRYGSFNREVKERTTGGVKVDISDDTDAKEVYIQRTGARTTTDMMKYAPKTFHDRGIRDRRTAGGNLLRSNRLSARDISHSKRYISATEQAIIDRKVRNTLAENKMEEEIKKVKEGNKQREEQLQLINDTKEKVIEQLRQKNVRQLHSHEVIAKSRMNATILGSDAEELNKILARGKKAGLSVIKDMIRKGELNDRGIIGQLDISVGQKNALGRILAQGSEWKEGQKYFFKDFDDNMNVRTLNGILRDERGNNVVLEMDDGSRISVRKRSIVLPEDFTPPKITPQLPPPPQQSQQLTDIMLRQQQLQQQLLQQQQQQQQPPSPTSAVASEDFSDPAYRPGSFRAPSGETYALSPSTAGGIPILTEAEQQEIRDNIYTGIMGGSAEIRGGGGRPLPRSATSDKPYDPNDGWLDGSTLEEEDNRPFFEASPRPFTTPPTSSKPDREVARYNKLLIEIPNDEKILKADELEFERLRKPPEGILAGLSRTISGKAKLDAEREKILDRIEKRRAKIIENKKEVNAIASNKGFEIPFLTASTIEGTAAEGQLLRRSTSQKLRDETKKAQLLLEAGELGKLREDETDEEIESPFSPPVGEKTPLGGISTTSQPSVESLTQSPRVVVTPTPLYPVIPLGGSRPTTPVKPFGSDLTLELKSDEEEEVAPLLQYAEETELDDINVEFEPEPEPSVSGGVADEIEEEIEEEVEEAVEEALSRKEKEEEALTKLYATMEVFEAFPQYVKFNWEGLDLLVDTQSNEIIDPTERMPSYSVRPFTDPNSIDFIIFPSEKVKKQYVELARSEGKGSEVRPTTPDVNPEGYTTFSFNRDNWVEREKSLDVEKFAELNDLAGENSLLVWSPKFPLPFKSKERGNVKGVIMSKKQFIKEHKNAGISGKQLTNSINKFEKMLREGKGNYLINDKRFLEEIGLLSSAAATDFRDPLAGGLE